MKRRTFITSSLLTVGTLSIGAAGWLSIGPGKEALDLTELLIKLEKLEGKKMSSSGEWSPDQIFNHLAQSVEYSMTGYPQHKSDLFKSTLGVAALSAFIKKGKMTHGLSEAIPGAPVLEIDDISKALSRLIKALINFANYQGAFKQHFAYGALSKQDYLYAHVMHINNHLEQITY